MALKVHVFPAQRPQLLSPSAGQQRDDDILKQGVDKGIKLEPGSSVDLVVAAPQGIYG